MEQKIRYLAKEAYLLALEIDNLGKEIGAVSGSITPDQSIAFRKLKRIRACVWNELHPMEEEKKDG
jgi:hypothetical protein